MPSKLFFGIMTGTSADGIDVVLLSISDTTMSVIDSESRSFTEEMQTEIKSLCKPSNNELFRAHSLGIQLSLTAAQIINNIVQRHSLCPSEITAIGYHGQTIRHHPNTEPAFSVQIGCPSTLAHHTKIKTIADFRMADIAAGGQGAPLVPPFHKAAFHCTNENRLIINIGGIANISFLPADTSIPLSGFDTGPGNTLLDEWIFKHKKKSYDNGGKWAKTGSIIPNLLANMLEDEYIAKAPPKSTGKEYFSLNWLTRLLKVFPNSKPEDVQRTILEFTCLSLSLSIRSIIENLNSETPFSIYLCGGGTNNNFLVERLAFLNPTMAVKNTLDIGLDPQLVEASAFAWLASRTEASLHGNLTSVSGASSDKVLGGIYPP